MQISENGLKIIKEHEGLRLKAYLCPAGIWTIGYGSTFQIKRGDVITTEQAGELLKKDVRHAQATVVKYVKVELEQNQFDALVSFIFNVGSGNFRSSTLLRMLNKGNYSGAEKQFKRWNKARVKGVLTPLRGLTRRRNDEAELFANADDGFDMAQAVAVPTVKTKLNSKTNIASLIGVGGVAATQFNNIENAVNKISDVATTGGDIADNVGGIASAITWPIVGIVAIVCIFGFIIWERNKKVDEYGL